MTDTSRAELLRRAVTLTAEADEADLAEIFAEDLSAWSPGTTTTSRSELAEELTARDELFAELSFAISSVDVIGDRGYAEWIFGRVETSDDTSA